VLQPIPLGEFVAFATTLNFPLRGLQSKVIKFLDDQVRRCGSGEIITDPDSADAGSSFPGPSERKRPSVASNFFFLLSSGRYLITQAVSYTLSHSGCSRDYFSFARHQVAWFGDLICDGRGTQWV